MERRFLIFLLSISLHANCQHRQKESLYFFYTKDSLLGVKNQSGKIIISPIATYMNYDTKKPIKDHLIYMMPSPDSVTEPHSWGAVYNRSGKFLFAPFMFDNGPDGFSEGLSRFVKNGKIGFVNRNGDVVINAKYDYADIFNYGSAACCNGCTWKSKGEHSFVSGGQWSYINYKGDTIDVKNKKASGKDQVIDSAKFLPYQFSYSKLEQKIIDSFYKLKEISKACFVNYYSSLDSNERQLYYEIVERPSSFFPYYHIAAFSYSNTQGYYGDPFGGLQFCVDPKGKHFFYLDGDEKIPLQKWLKQYIKEAKEYLKKHPDALYKF